MSDRKKALLELISFSKPVDVLANNIKQFDWDPDGVSVPMGVEHLCGVLLRYVGGESTAQDVEDWANLVEGREDIDFESSHAAVLDECLYELANPDLTSALSVQRACELIQLLNRD